MPYKIDGFESSMELMPNDCFITVHYMLVNGKRIKIKSKCDTSCNPAYRLFNGRDCPNRVTCLSYNSGGHVLSKNELGRSKMLWNKHNKKSDEMIDSILGNAVQAQA